MKVRELLPPMWDNPRKCIHSVVLRIFNECAQWRIFLPSLNAEINRLVLITRTSFFLSPTHILATPILGMAPYPGESSVNWWVVSVLGQDHHHSFVHLSYTNHRLFRSSLMVNRWDTNNGWMTIRALSFWPGHAPINGLPRHIITHRIPIRSGQVSQLMKNRKQSTNHHYLYTLVTTVIMAHRLAYRNGLIRVLQSMVQIFLYFFFFIHQLTYQSSRGKNGNC